MSDSTPKVDHFTAEGEGAIGSITTVEQARAAHHLASADPEVDGKMTGPAHEELYSLDRAESSAAAFRAIGVHPTENRALQGDEEGGRVAGDPSGLETVVNISDESETAVPAQSEKAVDNQGFETTAV